MNIGYRTHGIIDALAEAVVRCWADKGYQGAGGTVRVPYRARWENISAGQQVVDVSTPGSARAVGEQAMATLKSWRLLRKLRCSTTRITDLVKGRPCPASGDVHARLEKAPCVVLRVVASPSYG
ncbi:hypothetical protein M2283_010018 [Streptomyces pseudovenezuelae]|uniref:Uncharacterized protein n=1 Tax=Streptomyces pseudovenezuelae TaxID=67350 RepID=A0ABT6M293_9ACTN|nr:hypothetical protein [Streptomyces pseudovenezuelae]